MKLRRMKIELEAAQLALDGMRDAADVGAFRRALQEFVERVEKAWNKAKLECRENEASGLKRLVDRAASLRKTDPLLQYLTQARHADQHTLQAGTMFSLGMNISLPPGAELEIDFEKGTARAVGGKATVAIGKPIYRLLPVENKGVTFQPPAIHLGQVVPDHGDPITVAELGITFYCELSRNLQSCLDEAHEAPNNGMQPTAQRARRG